MHQPLPEPKTSSAPCIRLMPRPSEALDPDLGLAHDIMDMVSERTLVTRDKMLRQDKHPRVFFVRAAAMTLVYETTHLSLAEVAVLFERMDHGTVINARVKLANRRATEPAFDRWFRALAEEARALARERGAL